jgi:hypothetical protein
MYLRYRSHTFFAFAFLADYLPVTFLLRFVLSLVCARTQLRLAQLPSPTSHLLHRLCLKMDRLRGSKLSHLADKIAVASEPGLTSTQLLLTNGEPARQSFGKLTVADFWPQRT